MEQTILRSQVFKEILSGEPFDMKWVSADRRRGTGGDLVSAEGWMICSRDPAVKNRESGTSTAELLILKEESDAARKDPNHPENGTVNVFNPANAGIHPITVHWDLIQFFNGKRVIN